MVDLFIPAGDRLPPVRANFTDASGAPLDLTSAAVTFTMRGVDEVPVIDDATAEKVDPPTLGQVVYAWGASDTLEPGDYFARFTATFSGLRASAPVDRLLRIVIS